MSAIKQLYTAKQELREKTGVYDAIASPNIPNLLTVYYDPFPQPFMVLVGLAGLYILPCECEALGHDLTVDEIRYGLTALNIKILE